jgi:hypothetical protein
MFVQCYSDQNFFFLFENLAALSVSSSSLHDAKSFLSWQMATTSEVCGRVFNSDMLPFSSRYRLLRKLIPERTQRQKNALQFTITFFWPHSRTKYRPAHRSII